jgi:asparagine synthase (glutamine-hydrolysing)
MFAFFVWDAEARRGFAARDRLGVKPLAYAWDGVEFVFASEANVVARALAGPVRADEDAVLEYLVAPCFSGVARPMFAGVSYLQPGRWLELGPDGPAVRRYYQFEVAREGVGPSDEALRGAFERAVQRACLADEPLGIFLSGGLDSTAIAAVAAKVLNGGSRGCGPTRSCSRRWIMFGYGAVDDRRVERHGDTSEAATLATGVDWRGVRVPRAALAADLERVATTNDALPAWEQEVAQDRLARAAAEENIKAVLVGDAADETHYGYHFLLDPEATASPRTIINRFGGVAVRREVMADPVAVFADRYSAWMRGGDEDERIAGTTRLIVERWLPRLLHNGDIHCMRSGVEARVPFADIELLALAATVPPRAGLQGGEKARLRAALRGVVPEEIRTRRKSALPKDQHAQAVYQREAARLLAEPPALVRELVDVAAMRPLLDPSRELGEWERAGLLSSDRVVSLFASPRDPMSRALFVVLAEKGHVHPFIGPAQELLRRGHTVGFYSPCDLRGPLGRAGSVSTMCSSGRRRPRRRPTRTAG